MSCSSKGAILFVINVNNVVFVCKCQQPAGENAEPPTFIAEVLLHLTKDSARATHISSVKPCPPKERGEMQVGLGLINQSINRLFA